MVLNLLSTGAALPFINNSADVITALNYMYNYTQTVAAWVTTLYSLVGGQKYFGVTYCLCHPPWYHNPEARIQIFTVTITANHTHSFECHRKYKTLVGKNFGKQPHKRP
jgi:hypothetical protein